MYLPCKTQELKITQFFFKQFLTSLFLLDKLLHGVAWLMCAMLPTTNFLTYKNIVTEKSLDSHLILIFIRTVPTTHHEGEIKKTIFFTKT